MNAAYNVVTWSRRKFIRNGLIASVGFVLSDAFWLEKFFIETREFFIGPKARTGASLKLVQVSDLHITSLKAQLKRLARNLNDLRPDLICITGDAVDNRKNLHLLNQFLNLIDISIPKVAILGNWEYWGNIDLEALKAIYSNNNCDLLVNDSKQYVFKDRTVCVSGIDDYVGGKADISAALGSQVSSDYHVVLNHCPEYSDVIRKFSSPDLILSGHTHGGQINLFGFVPFKPRGSGRYLKGWYDENMYVSKGIGTSIFPVRFMARSEITVFHF